MANTIRTTTSPTIAVGINPVSGSTAPSAGMKTISPSCSVPVQSSRVPNRSAEKRYEWGHVPGCRKPPAERGTGRCKSSTTLRITSCTVYPHKLERWLLLAISSPWRAAIRRASYFSGGYPLTSSLLQVSFAAGVGLSIPVGRLGSSGGAAGFARLLGHPS